MICLEKTPNYVGVYMTGDINDFERLCSAIGEIVGEEGEFIGYEHVRIRLLDFCKTIEEVVKIKQNVVFVPNGYKQIKSSGATFTAIQENNIYYQIPVLWSDLLFIGFVLNDFIELSAKNNKHYWDITPATVRQFQGIISEHLEITIGGNKFRLLKSSLTPNFIGYYQNYVLQYIDHLGFELLKNTRDKRLAAISILAKRVAIKDKSYIQIKSKVENTAIRMKIQISEVEFPIVNFDEVDW